MVQPPTVHFSNVTIRIFHLSFQMQRSATSQPIDIIALAYNLSDTDFLALPPAPERAADVSSNSFDLSSLFMVNENSSTSEQNDSSETTEKSESSRNKEVQSSSQISSQTSTKTSQDIITIDLTSPASPETIEKEHLNTPISPPDSTASSKPDITSASPSQVYGSSVLQSPESLSSDTSCAGDLSNASSLLLQGNKDNDNSIIDFLLSEDSLQSNASSSSQPKKQCPTQQDSSRWSTESNKRKRPESYSDEVPELDINHHSTQKLDNFFNSIPDIRNEYLGRSSEGPCMSPYMCEADWLELIARCPPYSPTSCRTSYCDQAPAKRHCSPQHRQIITSPTSIPATLSPPQLQQVARPTSGVLFSNNTSTRHIQLHNNQPFAVTPQFSTSQHQATTNVSHNVASYPDRNLQQQPKQHHERQQQPQQQRAFTTTQKLSVLSGVTFHGASNALSTTAQERAEKLKGKPSDTYIALIARAILSAANLTSSLPDIYEQIMVQQPFYRTSTLAWRNAVRHNLSINECFVKVGKADSGRGWKWTIHPSCVGQFRSGDFRRREARSKVQQVHKKTVTQPGFNAPSIKY